MKNAIGHVVVIGISSLAILAPPASADSIDDGTTVAYSLALGGLLGVGCVALWAFTEDDAGPDDYDRRGWLLGASGNYLIETFQESAESDIESQLSDPTADLSADDSFGFSGRLGYRCHERVGTELNFQWFDKIDGHVSQDGLGRTFDAELGPIAATVDAKGFLLTGRYQPFVLFGMGFLRIETDLDNRGAGPDMNWTDADFAMRFGGGIDLYATKNVVVSAQADYLMPFGALDGFDFVTIGLGLQYRF